MIALPAGLWSWSSDPESEIPLHSPDYNATTTDKTKAIGREKQVLSLSQTFSANEAIKMRKCVIVYERVFMEIKPIFCKGSGYLKFFTGVHKFTLF